MHAIGAIRLSYTCWYYDIPVGIYNQLLLRNYSRKYATQWLLKALPSELNSPPAGVDRAWVGPITSQLSSEAAYTTYSIKVRSVDGLQEKCTVGLLDNLL